MAWRLGFFDFFTNFFIFIRKNWEIFDISLINSIKITFFLKTNTRFVISGSKSPLSVKKLPKRPIWIDVSWPKKTQKGREKRPILKSQICKEKWVSCERSRRADYGSVKTFFKKIKMLEGKNWKNRKISDFFLINFF